MTVFKYFLKLAWSKKFIILMYLVLFTIISSLTARNINRTQTGFIETLPDVRIIQEEDSALAGHLAQWLRTQSNEVEMELTEADAREAIFSNAVDAIIVIPEGFAENFRSGRDALRVYTDDRQMESVLLKNSIQKYLVFAKADEKTHGSFDPLRVEEALTAESVVTMAEAPAAGSNDSITAWFRYYFNFIAYILVAIFILVFGTIMAEFNDENVKRRNSLIPMSSTRFQLSIILAQLLLAFFITALFLAMGFVLSGRQGHGLDWSRHILNASVFSLAALALSFLINTVTRKPSILSSLSTVLSLSTSFISGVMVPAEILSPTVVTLSKFFPTYYYVKATEAALTGQPFGGELGIQLLFALLFLVLGLTISRVRQGEDLLPFKISRRVSPVTP